MPSRHAITVSLTPELARLVATNVTSGGHVSASEFVRTGLRLLFAAALNAQGLETQEVLRHVGTSACGQSGRRRRNWNMGDPPGDAPTSGSSLPPRALETTAAGCRSK